MAMTISSNDRRNDTEKPERGIANAQNIDNRNAGNRVTSGGDTVKPVYRNNDGKRGEERLKRALYALDPSFIHLQIREDSEKLVLSDPKNSNAMEYDCVIACPVGIINVDAKDYTHGTGEVSIGKYDLPHFYRYDEGCDNKTERKIFVQRNKQINLLREIVGRKVPIFSLICFTNRKYFLRIDGITSDVSGMLVSIDDVVDVIYSISHKAEKAFTQSGVEELMTKLENARIPNKSHKSYEAENEEETELC